MKKKFEIKILTEARLFIEKLDQKTKEKVLYNLKKAQYVNDATVFKKLNDSIWEFRTLYKGSSIRILAFWDKEEYQSFVLATHGFNKKTNKAPKNEIEKAELIKRGYFNQKEDERK
ncbi:type II toxin-antitoxin system RelE/ParE family toxin [Marivirga sp. S37H4]|uniref:Type II toxin-antitoxin system RelE/ParE family toxin n=1 Tax=Marivirga aurantiaca TaxID=2802615 RepID=A0A934WXF6_9BACT|nr:type II toxin-antitoxin system RelE/ParE family toxin [Marivirga aurantiaca]